MKKRVCFEEEEKCGYYAERGCYTAGYGDNDFCHVDIWEAVHLVRKERWKKGVYMDHGCWFWRPLVANEQSRLTSLPIALLLKVPLKFFSMHFRRLRKADVCYGLRDESPVDFSQRTVWEVVDQQVQTNLPARHTAKTKHRMFLKKVYIRLLNYSDPPSLLFDKLLHFACPDDDCLTTSNPSKSPPSPRERRLRFSKRGYPFFFDTFTFYWNFLTGMDYIFGPQIRILRKGNGLSFRVLSPLSH